jgi:hypothetical protein
MLLNERPCNCQLADATSGTREVSHLGHEGRPAGGRKRGRVTEELAADTHPGLSRAI